MSDDPTTSRGDQGAESSAPITQPAAAQPSSGESGAEDRPVTESTLMNDVFRGRIGAEPTSKPDEAASGGESAPQGDVKPADPIRAADGRFVSRRGVPEAVRTAEERAAEAERKLTEANPETLREQIRAELVAEQRQQADEAAQAALSKDHRAEAELYERALRMPLGDPRLDEPAPDGKQTLFAWREDRTELLDKYPQVDEHYRAQYDLKLADLGQKQQAFWDDVRTQMATSAGRNGIDAEAFAKLGRFDQMGDHLYEAGRATGRAELAEENRRLADENRQLRQTGPRGLAAARAPLAGGASTSAPAPPDMNARMRAAWGFAPPE